MKQSNRNLIVKILKIAILIVVVIMCCIFRNSPFNSDSKAYEVEKVSWGRLSAKQYMPIYDRLSSADLRINVHDYLVRTDQNKRKIYIIGFSGFQIISFNYFFMDMQEYANKSAIGYDDIQSMTIDDKRKRYKNAYHQIDSFSDFKDEDQEVFKRMFNELKVVEYKSIIKKEWGENWPKEL